MNHHYAITVPQPWANAVFAPHAPVDVLFRRSGTGYRGRLYIHAGMSYDTDAPAWVQAVAAHPVRGYVLGYVELDAIEDNGGGVWLWYLARPTPLAVPVRTHGWGGLWIIPEPDAVRMRT